MIPSINIKLVAPDHSTIVNINPQAKLSKMFKSYFELRNSVLFTFSHEGRELDPNKTAFELNIKDWATIVVIKH
jgi:hypothetical protein